jgi:hypothetical protein
MLAALNPGMPVTPPTFERNIFLIEINIEEILPPG